MRGKTKLPGVSLGGNADEPAGEPTFVHTAMDENSRGDYTYLGDPSINGDPNAVVLVTSSANG